MVAFSAAAIVWAELETNQPASGTGSGVVSISGLRNQSPPAVTFPGGRTPSFTLPRISVSAQSPGATAPVVYPSPSGAPTVITFMASWCIECRAELPLLEKAFTTLGTQVAFVGVDWNDSPGAAGQLLASAGVTFPVGLDSGGSVAQGRYNLYGLPDTFFVRPDGTVSSEIIGTITSEASLQFQVKRLIPAGRPG